MLVYLGAGIVRARGELTAGAVNLPYRALPAGALATLMNPYFFVWWATIGAALVVKAAAWGLPGLVLFGLVHWSCDIGWYWLVTVALARGGCARRAAAARHLLLRGAAPGRLRPLVPLGRRFVPGRR